MSKQQRPIGVYDSGIGGLTVLRALRQAMPYEDFVYFGDTANTPYGNKTKDQIRAFSARIINWFCQEKGAKIVVAACHTSSGLVLDDLVQGVDVPLVGTIHPVIPQVLALGHGTRLGVLATPASAQYKAHEKAFKAQGYTGGIQTIGCPNFVPLIEAGAQDSPEMEAAVRAYLANFEGEALFFGCTHYPYIKPVIERLYPHISVYVDPAQAMALKVKELLQQRGQEAPPLGPIGQVDFTCSGALPEFHAKVAKLWGDKKVLAA